MWKLTFVNTIVIASVMAITGWAIYETACYLVGGIGNHSPTVQFNATLFHYFLIFTGLGILISTVIHFYLTKKIIQPVKSLINSTELLKEGHYPPAIESSASGEIGELINQYNGLVSRLKENERRKKILIDDLSHELRTPISNISGYLYALKEGDIDGNGDLFQLLHEQSEQLANLIEQLEGLQLWQGDRQRLNNEKQFVASTLFIEQCLDLFSYRIQKESVLINQSVEHANLWIHETGMQQVVSNIIDNALRYRVDDSAITIVGKKKNNGYSIHITSKGEPISEEDRRQIFNRFYRVESSRNRATGGSGLGLAIAKEIVENHRGKLTLQSDEGNHTFSIFIPKRKSN